jgi:non-ribosomal peptide synthetase component F
MKCLTSGVMATSIPHRFEKIVGTYSDKLAVKMGVSLTYDELNRYANRIAHAVLEKRESSSQPIALFFEKSINQKSIDLIAAIFRVLKADKFTLFWTKPGDEARDE